MEVIKFDDFVNESKVNDIDVISMDVPLFIRMLEYAKEDAKTDMDLHKVTENILNILKNNDTLTMDNYDDIIKTDKK